MAGNAGTTKKKCPKGGAAKGFLENYGIFLNNGIITITADGVTEGYLIGYLLFPLKVFLGLLIKF